MGFLVLPAFSPGSLLQLVIAFLSSLAFMLLTAIARPFKDDADDEFVVQLREELNKTAGGSS